MNTTRGRPPARRAGTRRTRRPARRERALELWVALSRAHAALEAHAQAHAARYGLTLAEFGVLEALHHKGPLLLGEVQRAILVSSGGITYLVDALAARGLVERRACPEDRRARYAALTPAGEELIRSIFEEHARCLERAMDTLTAEEMETAADLLRRLGQGAAAAPRPGATGDGPGAPTGPGAARGTDTPARTQEAPPDGTPTAATAGSRAAARAAPARPRTGRGRSRTARDGARRTPQHAPPRTPQDAAGRTPPGARARRGRPAAPG